jgi:2,4-diaminopentanoate dehydrogenase
MRDGVRVVHFGLGPIGLGILDALLARPDISLQGVVDVDPAKAGQDVGALLGRAPIGMLVDADAVSLLSRVEADVAVVATTSKLALQEKMLVDLVARGLSVVSTCEELSFPWRAQHEIAARVDEVAKRHGRAVLATGVNPGFLMDHVPIALSGVMKGVRTVRVERVQDAAQRRKPFRDKVGVGAEPGAFDALMRERKVGHVGLRESVEMVAHALGFAVDRVEETHELVIAQERLEHGGVVVEPGRVRGVLQHGRGWVGGEEKITMVFRATFLQQDPHDRVVLDGVPPLDVVFKGGVPGDVATCAIVVNAVPAILRARPGLRTMAEMEPLASRAV